MEREEEGAKIRLVLDCNIWISDFLQEKSMLRDIINDGHYRILITSYMAVEILRVLQRQATRLSIDFQQVERIFWSTCQDEAVDMKLKTPVSKSLVQEVKNTTEFKVIAKLLDIEVKDIPYVVAAYTYKATILISDIRSFVDKRDPIKEKLGIDVLTLEEFLDRFQS